MTTLEQILLSEIRSIGPVTFRDFMDRALYDPEHGYYNTLRLKIGPSGDYYTSSNVHRAFGATLADAFVKLWNGECANGLDLELAGDREIASSESLSIVEFGAGTGQLPFDILSAIQSEHPAAFLRLKYSIVETSPAMRAMQQDKLSGFIENVKWIHNLLGTESAGCRNFCGIVFSNEFIDALPVHVVRIKDDGLQELYVRSIDSSARSRIETDILGRLAFSWGLVSTPLIERYVDRIKSVKDSERSGPVSLEDGQQIEVNLTAIDWLRRLSNQMNAGYVVTIDYGDLAPLLWSPERRNGTLRGFRNHSLTEAVLDNAGEQDITASVNFTALIEYGKDFGLEKVYYGSQSDFLVREGFLDRIASTAEASGPSVEYINDRLLLKNLLVPGGASHNFRVLIQRKVSRK